MLSTGSLHWQTGLWTTTGIAGAVQAIRTSRPCRTPLYRQFAGGLRLPIHRDSLGCTGTLWCLGQKLRLKEAREDEGRRAVQERQSLLNRTQREIGKQGVCLSTRSAFLHPTLVRQLWIESLACKQMRLRTQWQIINFITPQQWSMMFDLLIALFLVLDALRPAIHEGSWACGERFTVITGRAQL